MLQVFPQNIMVPDPLPACRHARATSRARPAVEPHSSAGPSGHASTAALPLLALKAVHTLIWLSVEACVVHILYKGVRRQWDRRAAVSAMIVASETLIFIGNGARCPLTAVARRMGAEHASVTDIFLPRWVAANLPRIHVPLIALALWLHVSIMLERRRTRRW
jgi:hypothetical protein